MNMPWLESAGSHPSLAWLRQQFTSMKAFMSVAQWRGEKNGSNGKRLEGWTGNCFKLFHTIFGNAEKAASPCSLLPIDFQGKRSPKDHKQKLATTRCLKVVDFGNSRVLEVASGGTRALPEQEVSVSTISTSPPLKTLESSGRCGSFQLFLALLQIASLWGCQDEDDEDDD